MRVMPKEMQIACFKRLFKLWNAWREEGNPGYDYGDDLAQVDFEAVVEVKANFSENIENLKNCYPEYTWCKDDIPQNVVNKYHEELKEIEKLKQEIEDCYESETPLGVWSIEKTAFGETHSIQIEILPVSQKSKGKDYAYGRIEVRVPWEWAGLPAKIIIEVPKL